MYDCVGAVASVALRAGTWRAIAVRLGLVAWVAAVCWQSGVLSADDEVPPEPKPRNASTVHAAAATSAESLVPAVAVSSVAQLEAEPATDSRGQAAGTTGAAVVEAPPPVEREAQKTPPEVVERAVESVASSSDAASATSSRGSGTSGEARLTPGFSDRIQTGVVPEWAEARPVRTGAIHTTAVASGPFFKRHACDSALDSKLKEKTDEYINEYLGNSRASLFPTLNYDTNYIRSRLLKPENVHYEQITGTSYGEMQQAHALLEFDEPFRRELDKNWTQLVKTSRLVKTGLGTAGIVVLLSILFGYFRADTATRGYYTRRLQFLMVTAILGLVATGIVLIRWLPAATWVPWI